MLTKKATVPKKMARYDVLAVEAYACSPWKVWLGSAMIFFTSGTKLRVCSILHRCFQLVDILGGKLTGRAHFCSYGLTLLFDLWFCSVRYQVVKSLSLAQKVNDLNCRGVRTAGQRT